MDILDYNLYNDSVDSSYYSAENFNSKYSISPQSNLFIVHHNIRSFNRNFDELACFMATLSCEIDILILSETWFTSGSVSNLRGYSSYHCTRNNRGGGGLSIYIRKAIECKAVPVLVKSCDLGDILCVEFMAY